MGCFDGRLDGCLIGCLVGTKAASDDKLPANLQPPSTPSCRLWSLKVSAGASKVHAMKGGTIILLSLSLYHSDYYYFF